MVTWGAGALASLLFVGLFRQEAPWMLKAVPMLVGFGFAMSYLVATLYLNAIKRPATGIVINLIKSGTIGVIVCLPVAVLGYVAIAHIGRMALAGEFVVVVGLVVLNQLPLGRWMLLGLNVIAVVLALQPMFTQESRMALEERFAPKAATMTEEFDVAFSSLYDLKLTTLPLLETRTFQPGGALSILDDRSALLVTGDGEIRLLETDGSRPVAAPGAVASPYESAGFMNDVENPTRYFRVTDMLTEHVSGQTHRVWVSYHHWDGAERCVTLRLAETTLDMGDFGGMAPEWQIVFESSPCLPADGLHNTTGGRIAAYTGSELLLTVGETSMDHSHLAQDPDASYGKILILNREDWSISTLSSGHRNPQGLWVDDDGIWATEHGPQGGDELNRIVAGGNYGWPRVTYGTEYGMKHWPANSKPGDHSEGVRPIYAWVPSIGVSNLLRVDGQLFTAWKGDFLVAALDAKGNGFALNRVKLYDESVRVVERIPVGMRVRDLIELSDGRLLLWDGVRSLQLVESASHVFSYCNGCHALRSDTHGIGPDLMSVVGRRVAFHEGFQYSPAMQAYGGLWTEERLDAFLADPQAEIPGTTMIMPGIDDPDVRKEIVQYIDKLSR